MPCRWGCFSSGFGAECLAVRLSVCLSDCQCSALSVLLLVKVVSYYSLVNWDMLRIIREKEYDTQRALIEAQCHCVTVSLSVTQLCGVRNLLFGLKALWHPPANLSYKLVEVLCGMQKARSVSQLTSLGRHHSIDE